jgi:hypothetical protein
LKIFTKLINTIYETGEWPKDFTEVTMIALKKTQATKCSDHRTMAMSTLVRFHLPLALSPFRTAFIKVMPFGACHGRIPQPVHTYASVDVHFVTSANGEFDGGI